jgi:hypothetical protein
MSLPGRPGAGLIVLGVSLLGAACFFAWGFATPPLEKVWRIQIELGLGEREALSESEFRLLQDTLRRYPDLAHSMLEEEVAGLVSANRAGVVDVGYAYLVRQHPGVPRRLQISAIGDQRVRLAVRTLAASAAGETRRGEAYTWEIPNEGPFPQLIEVRLDEERKSAPKQPQTGEPTNGAARAVVVTLAP